MSRDETTGALQTWVQGLLGQALPDLNRQYAEYPAAEKEVEQICDQYPVSPGAMQRWDGRGRVAEGVLIQLHDKIREAACEKEVWDALLFGLSHPLPAAVAHDLIDRDIAISAIGHSLQVDDVQWRMALFYRESRLTLAINLYALPEMPLVELQSLFDLFPDDEWMIKTLMYHRASSPEKEQAYLRLERDPARSERFLRSYHINVSIRHR